MPLPPHGELVDRLRARLREPLPGLDAQVAMAPKVGENLRQIRQPPDDCRHAAVLALLYPRDDGRSGFVLTLRQKALQAHSGQVCLPGGSLDEGETATEAALREANEEVGLDPAAPVVLGELSRLYIPPSGFCVTPVVAAMQARPGFRRHEAEVAAVIEAPLDVLLDEAARAGAVWHLQGADVEVPFFRVAGHEVWGATAMMLSELAAVLREVERGGASSPAPGG